MFLNMEEYGNYKQYARYNVKDSPIMPQFMITAMTCYM